MELRGDGEYALQAFLRAVRERLEAQGLHVVVTATAPDAHQGIAEVEKAHDILAGFVRTICTGIRFNTGL